MSDQDRKKNVRMALVLASVAVVLFLGTGYGRKGLAEVIDAFPALRRARPEARLLVVGYESGAQAYVERAQRLGLAPYARAAVSKTSRRSWSWCCRVLPQASARPACWATRLASPRSRAPQQRPWTSTPE